MENAAGEKTQTETREKRAVRGRPFKPGNGGGPGRGKKKPLAAAAETLIADMDKAYSTAESPSDSPMVKALRRMAHEDTLKFLDQYAKAKSKAGDAEPSENGAAEEMGSVGPKEVALEELAERLLGEWELEEAKAKAEAE